VKPVGWIFPSTPGTHNKILLTLQDEFGKLIDTSDNFAFQINGMKKYTCWKTIGFLENNGFLKQCV